MMKSFISNEWSFLISQINSTFICTFTFVGVEAKQTKSCIMCILYLFYYESIPGSICNVYNCILMNRNLALSES